MKTFNTDTDSIISEAKKWFNKGDFRQYSPDYYYLSLELDLMNNYYWMSPGYKFELTVEDATKEAMKYKYFDDFIYNSNKEYTFSRRIKILNTFSWLELSEDLKKKKKNRLSRVF